MTSHIPMASRKDCSLLRFRSALGAVALATASLLIAAPALAHTTKDAGPYKLTFGWLHEPAYTAAGNAVQLFVKDAKGNPLDDLGQKGLTVAVTAGGKTSSPLPLTSGFDADTGLGTHGEFDASIVPTQAGTYTFHITGDIGGTAVDVSASSSDTTFNNVVDPGNVEFPLQTQTIPQLTTAVTNLQDRLSAANSAADAAKSSAKSAKTLGVAAIVVAVILGAAAIIVGSRKAKGPGAA